MPPENSSSAPESSPSYLPDGIRTIDLFVAISQGAWDIASQLIKSGADVNIQDAEGRTPLHYAVALGARRCIRLLVNSGRCDYSIQDKQGRYASDIAIEWTRDYAVGRLLSKKQAMQAYIKDGRPDHPFRGPVGS